MERKFHPYLIILPDDPSTQQDILTLIFGSEIAMEIIRKIGMGISTQKELIDQLTFSNKTIIEKLKKFIELGILEERTSSRRGAPKWYEFTKMGKWFSRLIMYRKYDMREYESLLEELTNTYLEHVIGLWLDLHGDHEKLREIFEYNLSKLLKKDQIKKSALQASVQKLIDIHEKLSEMVSQIQDDSEFFTRDSKRVNFLKEFNEMYGLLNKKLQEMKKN
ncbi:MAG: hypothetical protein ACTSRW_05060 [Candidatus Helarchaeota archaeon]